MDDDQNIRLSALNCALRFFDSGKDGVTHSVKAENIVTSAKIFYEFLKGDAK